MYFLGVSYHLNPSSDNVALAPASCSDIDNVIHWINYCPSDSTIGFPTITLYLLGSVLSGGYTTIQHLNNKALVNSVQDEFNMLLVIPKADLDTNLLLHVHKEVQYLA